MAHLREGSVILIGGSIQATVTNITDAYIEYEWMDGSTQHITVRSWTGSAVFSFDVVAD